MQKVGCAGFATWSPEASPPLPSLLASHPAGLLPRAINQWLIAGSTGSNGPRPNQLLPKDRQPKRNPPPSHIKFCSPCRTVACGPGPERRLGVDKADKTLASHYLLYCLCLRASECNPASSTSQPIGLATALQES